MEGIKIFTLLFIINVMYFTVIFLLKLYKKEKYINCTSVIASWLLSVGLNILVGIIPFILIESL